MGSGVEKINFIKCNLSATAIFRADILLFNKHFLIQYLIEAEKIDIFLNYGTYKLKFFGTGNFSSFVVFFCQIYQLEYLQSNWKIMQKPKLAWN
jgi:hypothetical protein